MNENLFPYELPIPYHPSFNAVDASKLKEYVECPRKFFFSYLLGWRPETPNNHLEFGTALHLALEHLMQFGYTADSVVAGFDKFLHSYRQSFDQDMDELFFPKTPDRTFKCLAEYCQKYNDDLSKYKVLHTEVAFRVMLNERFSMVGRMDSIVEERATGQIFSMDHKSASSFYGWEEQFPLSLSTGLYSHALYCVYGFEKVGGMIYNGLAFLKAKGTRGGKLFDFHRLTCSRSKSQMQVWYVNILHQLARLDEDFRALSKASANDNILEAFPMHTTACGNWGGCKYRDYCDAWPNPLKRAAQPPLGFIQQFWNPLEDHASVRMELEPGKEPIIQLGENENEISN